MSASGKSRCRRVESALDRLRGPSSPLPPPQSLALRVDLRNRGVCTKANTQTCTHFRQGEALVVEALVEVQFVRAVSARERELLLELFACAHA